MSAGRLLVVTVAFGAPEIVRDHLRTWASSLRHLGSGAGRVRVRIVDNSPSAELGGLLEELDWGETPLDLVARPDNPGFAGAVNLGAFDLGDDEHLVLLNPDVAVAETFFATLLDFAGSSPAVRLGAIPLRTGAAVRGGVGVGRWLHFHDRPIHPRRHLVLAGPSGGGAVIPGAAWRELGGLWEPFFAWGEDADLALRAWTSGWTTALVPVEGIHLGGHTLVDQSLRRRKARLLARNRVWYLARQARPSLLAILAGPWSAALLAIALKNLSRGTATATLAGLWDGVRTWPMASRSRPRVSKLSVRGWLSVAAGSRGPQ